MNASTINDRPIEQHEPIRFVESTGRDEHTTHCRISYKGLFLLWWGFMAWVTSTYVLDELGVDRTLQDLVAPVVTFAVLLVMLVPFLMGGHGWHRSHWRNHLNICLGLLVATALVVAFGNFLLKPLARLVFG